MEEYRFCEECGKNIVELHHITYPVSYTHLEVMTMKQIKKAWGQGTAFNSGKSKAHNDFTDEMAKKTVRNRVCKMFANTSDDSDVLIEAFNNSDKSDFSEENQEVQKTMTVKEEISQNANSKVIDLSLIHI